MYTFKNRSHYAQSNANSVPTTWEQAIANREITWKLGLDGLSYRVTGTRVNHGGSVVIPEHSQVVLFEGTKSRAYEASTDLLQSLADAWAAVIMLGDGEAYRGHNGQGEGPDTVQVTSCSEGAYPYFRA